MLVIGSTRVMEYPRDDLKFSAHLGMITYAGAALELALFTVIINLLGDAELAIAVAGGKSSSQMVDMALRLCRARKLKGKALDSRKKALDAAKRAGELRNSWVHCFYILEDGPIGRVGLRDLGDRRKVPLTPIPVTERDMQKVIDAISSAVDGLRSAFRSANVSPIEPSPKALRN